MRDKAGTLRTACTVVFHVTPSTQCGCREYQRPDQGTRCQGCGHGATFHEKGQATAPQWDSDEDDVLEISDDEAPGGRPASADRDGVTAAELDAAAAGATADGASTSRSTKRTRRRRRRKRAGGASTSAGDSSHRIVRSPLKPAQAHRGTAEAWAEPAGSVGGRSVRSSTSTRRRRMKKSATVGTLHDRGARSGAGGVVSTTQPRRVFAKEGDAATPLHRPPDSKRLTKTELSQSVARLSKTREVKVDAPKYERVGSKTKLKGAALEKSLSRLLLRPERCVSEQLVHLHWKPCRQLPRLRPCLTCARTGRTHALRSGTRCLST